MKLSHGSAASWAWLIIVLCCFFSPLDASSSCPNSPFTTNACPTYASGYGILAPANLAVIFGSSPLSTQALSWKAYKCVFATTSFTNYMSSDGGATFATQTLIASSESSSVSVTLPNYDALIIWGSYAQCFPNGQSTPNYVCWVIDTSSTRNEDNECYRSFTYCKRPADTTLQGPLNGQVFQQVSKIDFTWSDIAPTQAGCLSGSAITSFVYVFSIWSTANLQTTTPIFNTTIPVGSTPKYSWTPNLAAGTYYWSVKSTRIVNSANLATSDTSTTTTTQLAAGFSFRLCGADVAPSTPALTSPTNNQAISTTTYTIRSGVTTSSVTFSWSVDNFGLTCNAGSNVFTLFWSKNSNFLTGVSTQTLTAPTNSYSADLGDGTWYWKVQASNGVKVTNSTSFQFTVCALVPPSTFSVSLPADNAQGVDFSSVTFTWGTSTKQATCGSSEITYSMAIGASSTAMYVNYTGSNTSLTKPFSKGTWYWQVTATDSNGQSTKTPIASFVTVSSLCADVPPSPGVLNTPTYQYLAGPNPITVTLSWTSPSLGVSCSGTSAATLVVDILGSGGSPHQTHNLSVSATSMTVALPSKSYTWFIKAYNAGQAVATYSSGTFSVCDITATTSFAGSFGPADQSLDTSHSVPAITWAFTNPPTSCLGGTMTYNLHIYGATSILIPLPDQSVVSYSIASLGPGTWTWTLSNDVSNIPIPNLPTTSYTRTFSICQPAVPGSPTLTLPSRFQQIISNETTLSWTDLHNNTDSCTPYYIGGDMDERYSYDLFLSKSSTFSSTATSSVSVYRDEGTTFNYLATNLTAGTYFWRIRVTKEVLVNSVPMNSLTQTTAASAFSICLNTPPIVPTLLFPANGTVFQRCNITTTLEWVPLGFSDYGIDCTETPVSRLTVYLGPDPSNLPYFDEVLAHQPYLDRFSVLSFQPNTMYYWRIVISNSNYNASSEIFSFKTPNTATTACSGHGSCNNQGTCTCSAGFTGAQCASAIPTQPHGTQDQNQGGPEIGAIVGGVAGGLFLLLLLAFVAFFVLRRKAKKLMEKPVRPPPDFPPLAFTIPPGYPPLATEKIVPWYSFEQLLVSNGFAVSFALLDLAQPAEVDEVVKCLVYIIESHGQGANFIKALITKDLKEKKASNNLTSATLFRDNSHASKAFKTYSKIVGLPYIFYAYGDIIYEMCSNDQNEPNGDTMHRRKSSVSQSGTLKARSQSEVELQQVVVRKNVSGQSSFLDSGSMEVDPNKMSEDEDSLSNAISLQLKCQKLLVKLFRTVEIFPAPLSGIFVHLMSQVQQYLTLEDGYNAVAAFVFLRLVNPAILFPHQYGLVDVPPSEGMNRQLILITKVLQNLANGVHFGNKEQHMVPLNDFIDSNKGSLRNFLDNIMSDVPEPTQAGKNATLDSKDDNFFRPLDVPRSTVETSLSISYNQFYRNQDRLRECLNKYRTPDEVKIIENKSNALVQTIGDPIVPITEKK